MRWKMSASVLVALAFLIPAAPAMAQAAQPGLDAGCQTVERKVYSDVRKLITIDLDTATDSEVRVLANQILAVANAESLPVLPDAIQNRLGGTEEDLREFVKNDVVNAWSLALRVTVTRTLTDAGPNVEAAAQKVLAGGSSDVYLAYLNEGLYAARELDCAAQPSPTPTPDVTPSFPVSPTPVTSASAVPGGEGGGELPKTGVDITTVAAIGGVLVVLGGLGFLFGRRRRSRFVA
ncbi:ALF repeat-containing protein [Catenuloplanes japonicus]|uniref:ALF repeat-containing protein n=1 Tax=Catenuloplanes japonicus TaxID=33876 RepID=UPI0005253B0A|nr:ALF repeat-containing protein [Catenuloplanes japonicus]